MIAEHLNPTPTEAEIIPLTVEDAEEMRALALLTKPGPFYARTHLLGDFVGIKKTVVLSRWQASGLKSRASQK
jgi:hypothetical protein